jgi:NAD(P)-dependent dehydrogenase (short-subunit alcohol dehydrogenase family)
MHWGPYTAAIDVCNQLQSSIKGRTVLVTGTSAGGLGLATAQAIARAGPGLLIITGRSDHK